MQSKKGVTAAELARVFKITSGDARHHLTSLEDEGVITVVDVLVKGRGRPTQIYRLSQELTRHNLSSLTQAVLEAWLGNMPENGREEAYHKIANRIVSACSHAKGSLTQRLATSINQLGVMNYQARWEAHIDAPRIIITYCPYAALLPDHPEICRIDEIVVGDLVGQSTRQIAMIGKNETGDKQCIFRINPSVSSY